MHDMKSRLIAILLVLIGANACAEELPLWDPFAADLSELLLRESALISRRDGGPGSNTLILHMPGTYTAPEFSIDGIPLGVGHRWCDDPALVPQAGLRLDAHRTGAGFYGSNTPQVFFRTVAVDSGAAGTDTRFLAGSHDNFLRRISFNTLQAPLEFRFLFDEYIDHHAWDFSVPEDTRDFGLPYTELQPDEGVYKGETASRRMQAILRRNLSENRFIELIYRRTRQHKTGLPVIDVKHQEIWADQVALNWQAPMAGHKLSGFGYINSVDLAYDSERKQEVVREGASLMYQPAGRALRLDLRAEAWRLFDNGEDMGWAGDHGGAVRSGGQQADLALTDDWRLAGQDLQPQAVMSWHRFAGWRPAFNLQMSSLAGVSDLHLDLGYGGRAPRSDELLTVARVTTPMQSYLLLPEADLGWEKQTSARLSWRRDLIGLEFNLSAAMTALRDGINWEPLSLGSNNGRWTNRLELDSRVYEVSATRRGEFAGRYRLQARLVSRDMDLIQGTRLGLPPERSATAHVFWERAMFAGDGILECGYILDHNSAMPDPWLPGTDIEMPSATFHHLTLGFRLVGADLGMDLLNLTNQQVQLSSGALSNGFERRWRLHWTFQH
jgi:hypothetical protein